MSRRAETRAPLLALLVSAVFCLPLDANDFIWPILIWSLTAAVVIGWSSVEGVERLFGRLPRRAGFAAMALLLLISSYADTWQFERWSTGSGWIMLGLAVLGASGVIMALRMRDWIAVSWAGAGLLTATAGLAMKTLPMDLLGAVMMNAIALGAAGATISVGYSGKRLSVVNWGLGFLALCLALRFLDGGLPILPRAVLFILLGLALVILNIFLSQRIRKEKA